MTEYELTDMKKETKDPESKIDIYAMVDLDNQHVYALKVITLVCNDAVMLVTILGTNVYCQVAIATATSSATGYYLLPSEDYTGSKISTEPDEVCVITCIAALARVSV